MLKVIIYKEIADNIRNLRFTIGSLLILIMSVVCVVVLTSHYNNEVKEYHQRIAEQNAAIAEFAHVNRLGVIMHPNVPPSKFHPLVLGLALSESSDNFNNDPLNTLFPPFDFVVIVSILMSLMAILFSYNSISGEAEDGTLRLMLSNQLPRMLLLAGKWIGGTICIFIPFLLSFIIISIYITLSPVIQWESYHWACFALLCLASLLFISIFYLIGLTISCLTKNSTMSMLLSLFVWVLFILVIPNLSPYTAAQFYKVPSVNKIEKETGRITGVDRDRIIGERMNELMNQYSIKYSSVFDIYEVSKLGRQELSELLDQNSEAKEIYTQFMKDYDTIVNDVNREQNATASRLYEDLVVKSESQTRLAKNIAAISPYACFSYIATDITGTGLHNTEYLEKFISPLEDVFFEYVENKFMENMQQDPTFGYNSFIDLSDRPQFIFEEEPIRAKLSVTLPYWVILAVFNALFLSLAFISFRRYDVR